MYPLLRLAGWSPRILWYTGLEAILESSRNALHVSHTSGTGGLSALGLLAPVVYDPVLAISFAYVPLISHYLVLADVD
jgi:hypothetical protein